MTTSTDLPTPPWEGASVGRTGQNFSLRLNERQKKQLAFVVENGRGIRSAHALIIDILSPALEAKAAALWREINNETK